MADLEARFRWVSEGGGLFTHTEVQSSLIENMEYYLVKNGGTACKKFWEREK